MVMRAVELSRFRRRLLEKLHWDHRPPPRSTRSATTVGPKDDVDSHGASPRPGSLRFASFPPPEWSILWRTFIRHYHHHHHQLLPLLLPPPTTNTTTATRQASTHHRTCRALLDRQGTPSLALVSGQTWTLVSGLFLTESEQDRSNRPPRQKSHEFGS